MYRTASVLICLLFVLTGCGDQDTPPANGEQMRTMTEQEAAQRAEEHIQRAVAALPEEPTLTLQRDDSAECLDPTDSGPRGRYEVGKTYWLDDLRSDRNKEYVAALHEFWTTNNFRVLNDFRPDRLFISVEHNEDAFRMSVTESTEGDLSLGASSPCIWPDGTPPADAGQ
ncbi:hypothetical protein SAMN05216266_101797 [Amycolatopsis marina]|uniref:Lipoprotein n=1 Tax=Amycolatopsis marina TaxID=490629 RepID=A0A1I0W6N0_9PSEU|nr:hypothetical protein [Amycolatopsis marina]SFA84429.1 hypothetical protein SAMN05216266_101797 [Amycolatopsis marina]